MRPALVALVALGALLAAAPASAVRSHGLDMHNARYCEILEVKQLPPDGKVVVWNTIGLNDCPQEWWEGFDAPRSPRSSVIRSSSSTVLATS
ncbi:MAG: hypothetical protein R2700_15485 [Solirubrobacterales bacterium]